MLRESRGRDTTILVLESPISKTTLFSVVAIPEFGKPLDTDIGQKVLTIIVVDRKYLTNDV